MVTAPDVSAMGLDTSIVADLTAAVISMHGSQGRFGAFYLSYSQRAGHVFGCQN
jgi:hypothetical protein